MALTAQVALSIIVHENTYGSLAQTFRVTPASHAVAITDGTGADQAQVAWSASKTLSGSTQSLNLASLDDGVTTVTLTAVKVAYVKNTGASSLTFSGAPFPAGGVAAAPGAVVFLCDTSANGLSASTVTVAGSTGGTYDVVFIGEGSVA